MKNIYFIFLIPIIGLTISSCANSKEDTSGALTQMDQVLDQPNSTDDGINPDFPTVTISSCYLLNNSTIDNSTIDNSTISDNSSIYDSTVKNCSTVSFSQVRSSTVDNSTIIRSKVDNSTISYSRSDNSTIDNSTASKSRVDNSTLYYSTDDNSTFDNSTVRFSTTCFSKIYNSTLDNSTACYATLDNSTIRLSVIDNSTISNSTTDNNSTIKKSTITSSTINSSIVDNGSNVCQQSIIDNSTIDNATVCNNSTVTGNSTVKNSSSVCNSTIDNATIDNATVCNSTVSNRTIQNLTMSDSVAPNVSSVSSDNSSASYSAGSNISINVTFNESVFVDNSTGNPRIELETGDPDGFANYISTSDNGSVLYFIYTVVSGDNSTDLDYKSTSSLSANSGTIRDNSSNDATLTLPSPGFSGSLGANKAIVIDTTAPTVTFSPANSATGVALGVDITITFSEAVRNTDDSELTDSNIDSHITLKKINVSGVNISFDAAIDGDKKVITINPAKNLSSSQAVYVAIGATVEDSVGNVIAADNATFTTQ